jgi:uncharacterized protein
MDNNMVLGHCGCFLKVQKVLVIADLHIGLEESLNRQGILMPRFQFEDILRNLHKLLEHRPKTVVLAGDIKHEFGNISPQEWRDTLKVIDLLSKDAKVVLVKGNHDTFLGPVAKKRDLAIADHFSVDGYYVCHGDEIPKDREFGKARTVIIGHKHPAITLKSGPRAESYKCYLWGKYRKKNLLVLPSMSLITEGTDILTGTFNSPFVTDVSGFRVLVSDGKLYDFGLVKDL